MFQRFQIQLEQDIGVQHTALHTFQQHDGVIVKIDLFEFQVVIFSVVRHRAPSWGDFRGLYAFRGPFGGRQRINHQPPSYTLEKVLDLASCCMDMMPEVRDMQKQIVNQVKVRKRV